MVSVALFWVLLCVPGCALLRRFHPSAFEGGALSVIALSYLASFTLLTPVSLLGYAFNLPLWVLSLAVVCAVLCGSAYLFRELISGFRRPRLSPIALVCGGVIGVVMLMALRAGAYTFGDARYHTARVRMLLSYGFNNWDPFASGPHFDRIYNTNIYHALMAAAGQLTGLNAPDVWAYTGFWAQLAVAAATGHLAFTVLGRRWLGWIAGAACAVWVADEATLAYPNSLGAFMFLPLGLAFIVEAWVGEGGMRPAISLAAISAVLVQIHALYFVFLCLIAGPTLLVRLVFSLRSLPRRRELAFSLLALALGAPWFAGRAWHSVEHVLEARASAQAVPEPEPEPAPSSATNGTETEPALKPAPGAAIEEDEPEWAYRGFRRLPNGRIMLDPRVWRDPQAQYAALSVALLLGLWTRRREHFLAASIALGTVMAALFLPPLCTALQHAAGSAWIVHRLTAIIPAAALALFPGALVLLLAERISHGALQALGLVVALGYSCAFGAPGGKSFAVYFEHVKSPIKLRQELAWHTATRQWFRANIPAGTIVAAPIAHYFDLTTDCDCYPLALPRSKPSHGMADAEQRWRDAALLLSPKVALRHRLKILRTYGVHQIYLPRRVPVQEIMQSYESVTSKVASLGGARILTIDTDRHR